jgi:DNA-binding transcriptional regulator YdaS (Cro superfamily)
MARQTAPVPTDAACAAAPGPTVTFPVHFRAGVRGRRRLRTGGRPTSPEVAPGRIPRISRLMALAIRYDQLIRQGVIRDYADIARLGGVSKARVSQVMALLDLCPAIQEQLLFLPRTTHGRDPITERQLRPITTTLDWGEQRALWCMGTQVGVRSQTIQNPGGRSHA